MPPENDGPSGSVLPLRILTIARAQAVLQDGRWCFPATEGSYLEGIAEAVEAMTLVAPVQRPGRDTTASSYKGYDHRLPQGIRQLEIPVYKKARPRLLDGLRDLLSQCRLIRRELAGHDTVFVMMSTFRAAYAAVAGRRLGRRVILYSGNDWYADMASSYKFRGGLARGVYPLFRWFCGFAERRAMAAAHLRILNGHSLVVKYGSLPGRTVETKPLLAIRREDMAPLRDTCQGAGIRLLTVAGLMPRKGIEHLLRAMTRLDEHIRLELIGNEQPAYGAMLRSLCSELGLQDRVSFAGYVANGPELMARYREADLFVLPSLSEGFPRVLFEAMAQSLPIVASRIPNIHGRLGDQGFLRYAEAADPDSLAEAITAVISQGVERRAMITLCHNYIGELLTESPVSQFVAEAGRLLE